MTFFWRIINFFYFVCFILVLFFFTFSFYLLKLLYQLFYFQLNLLLLLLFVFLNYYFRSSFCSIYPSFCCSIHWFFTIFLTKLSNKWQKAIFFNIFSVFWFYWKSHFYNIYPIIRVILTLSSISSCLLLWSVNHTSMDENSVFIVFNIVNKWGDILTDQIACLVQK